MRNLLLYGCLGLISVSSFAGCELLGSDSDGYYLKCPQARRVADKGDVVLQMRAPATESVTISGSSRPIAAPSEPVVVRGPSWQPPMPVRPAPIPEMPVLSIKPPDAVPPPVDVIPPMPLPPDRPPEETVAARPDAIPPGRPGTLSIEEGDGAPIQVNDAIETVHQGAVAPVAVDPPTPALPAPAPPTPARLVSDDQSRKNEAIQAGASEDVKTITGQVLMWRKSIRLRYAPIDQDDPYGGFVVLQGNAQLADLREGQYVRVRGVLIPPENRNRPARFKVQAIELQD